MSPNAFRLKKATRLNSRKIEPSVDSFQERSQRTSSLGKGEDGHRYRLLVRARGLEPPLLTEPDPKSGASAISPRARSQWADLPLTVIDPSTVPRRRQRITKARSAKEHSADAEEVDTGATDIRQARVTIVSGYNCLLNSQPFPSRLSSRLIRSTS